MAVSLASGHPCLGLYEVQEPGPVLLFMAEDSASVVKQRLAAISRHHDIELEALPIYVITAQVLRLDRKEDQARLRHTVQRIKPRMLLLDPLVRLHGVNENSAGEVSSLLAYFRQLQRAFHCAVVIVHHSRKNANSVQPGQALRGSGDLHAFGDSNLYLRRNAERLTLAFEHRAAPAAEPVELRLVASDDPHLEVIGIAKPLNHTEPLDDRVVQLLLREEAPLTRREMRTRLAVRNTRLGEALNRLRARGRIVQKSDGFAVAS